MGSTSKGREKGMRGEIKEERIEKKGERKRRESYHTSTYFSHFKPCQQLMM